ncbi:MAG: ABC transporter permease [Cellulosilyticaceae bacterium]
MLETLSQILETLFQVFPYAIALTIPLLITALGALYCERSGVINVGLDGLMIFGSFTCAVTITVFNKLGLSTTLGVWVGITLAVVVGILFSLLHAFASINLKANQVISGTAINMIALALTVFLARNITGSGDIRVQGLAKADVPILSKIPVIGDLFFQNSYITTWLVVALLAIFTFLLYKTSFGLRLRACGENPHAADAAGVNVYKMRYIGVTVSGAFAGLGGAIYLVTFSGVFNGAVSGFGFLALAALIFGQWKPLGILGATLFFGTAMTIANVSQVIPSLSSIPPVFLKTFPYVVTLLALIVFSKSTQAPKASGESFDQGKR